MVDPATTDANPEMRAAARRMGEDPTARRAVQNTGLYRPAIAFGAPA